MVEPYDCLVYQPRITREVSLLPQISPREILGTSSEPGRALGFQESLDFCLHRASLGATVTLLCLKKWMAHLWAKASSPVTADSRDTETAKDRQAHIGRAGRREREEGEGERLSVSTHAMPTCTPGTHQLGKFPWDLARSVSPDFKFWQPRNSSGHEGITGKRVPAFTVCSAFQTLLGPLSSHNPSRRSHLWGFGPSDSWHWHWIS